MRVPFHHSHVAFPLQILLHSQCSLAEGRFWVADFRLKPGLKPILKPLPSPCSIYPANCASRWSILLQRGLYVSERSCAPMIANASRSCPQMSSTPTILNVSVSSPNCGGSTNILVVTGLPHYHIERSMEAWNESPFLYIMF